MPLGKRQRKVLLGIGIFLAVIILLIVSLPLWFPWVARPIASKQGAHYSHYERLGYNRFAVEGAGFTNEDIHFRAKRVEGLTPSIWSWRIISPSAKQAAPFLNVEGWELELLPSTKTNKAGYSIYTNIQEVAAALRSVERLIPAATLSNGTIRIQSTVLTVRDVRFNHGELRGQVEWPEKKQSVTVTANLTNLPSWKARLESDTLHLQGAIDFTTRTNTGILQSTWLWWSNQIDLGAQFAREGVLPETAVARAQQLRIPTNVVRLPGYEDISGSLSAKWEKGQFAVDINGKGTPLKAETNLPPVTIDLHGRGDTNAAVISSAVISSPWLKAELSKEVTLHFNGELLREPATMKIAADLSRQPWARLEGKLSGEADFTPNGEKFPKARFTFSGTNLGGYRIQAKTLMLKGGMDWPLLEITNVNAVLDDGSTISLTGKIDLEKQQVQDANAKLSGRLAQRFLPADYGYQNLSLSLNAQGPLKQLAHRGEISITNITLPKMQPVQLHLNWSGEEMNLKRAEVSVIASNSTLSTVFSMVTNQQPSLTNITINLEKLSLQKGSQTALELEKPSTIVMGKGETNRRLLQVEGFNWRGPSGQIALESRLDWPNAGHARITGENLHSDLLDDFFTSHTEKFEIGKLGASAGWTNGPLVFRVEVVGSGVIGGAVAATQTESRHVRSPVVPERRLEEAPSAARFAGQLSLQMLVMGDQHGIAISNLVVNSETSTVAMAHGFLPATVNPSAQSNMLKIAVEKPLNLDVTTKPQSILWRKLSDLTGVVLHEPNLNVNLGGTWKEPTGEVHADVGSIQLPATNQMIPKLEKLKLGLKLSPQVAKLSECDFLAQGQHVTATGELPLEKAFWESIGKKKAPDWRDASARIRMDRAQISAFQPLFPKYLSPQGEVTFEARLVPGGNFEGELEIAGARSRPFPNIGPVRDIHLRAKLRDLVISLEQANALVGGSAVRMSGEGDLRGTNWFKEEVPPFKFALRGTNVPISRQPDSVIRSDLTLSVTKTNGAPTLITGTVRMRDSFYLSDITDLVPGKVASPSRRPPYFSIEDEPFDRWRLSLHVTGERGMRVRSTLFNGQITPNLRIQGTLKEPLALGDAKIDTGTVRLPFADFQVQQGLVTLSSDNPYRPTLLVNASSKRFGYDVKMDVTGFADGPVIQFSSTPPLSSEQLVLMVTAGELPKTGYTLSPQQRAQTAALFVGKDLLAKLGFGDSSEPRLTITSGAEISEEGKPTYEIEYKLTDRWALEGEYDRFNAYNAGLKWRVYSK
jgi:translocation and assembly module TamB